MQRQVIKNDSNLNFQRLQRILQVADPITNEGTTEGAGNHDDRVTAPAKLLHSTDAVTIVHYQHLLSCISCPTSASAY